MFCFIWPTELSVFESAWSSLNLAQISSRFSWAIRDPRFSRVLRAVGSVGGRKGHLLIVTTFANHPTPSTTADQEKWYGGKAMYSTSPHSETQKYGVVQLLHTEVLLWETSSWGGYASLWLKSGAHSAMNCKHPPDDYPHRFPVLLLLSTPPGHLTCCCW